MSEQPVAVVTGANRGLGLETSRQLAALGYLVLLTARREPEGRAAAQRLATQGLSVRFHPLDVNDEASVRALAETVRGIGRARPPGDAGDSPRSASWNPRGKRLPGRPSAGSGVDRD